MTASLEEEMNDVVAKLNTASPAQRKLRETHEIHEARAVARDHIEAEVIHAQQRQQQQRQQQQQLSVADDKTSKVSSLETIQQDWLSTIATFEKAFENHCLRLEVYCANIRAGIYKIKQLGDGDGA